MGTIKPVSQRALELPETPLSSQATKKWRSTNYVVAVQQRGGLSKRLESSAPSASAKRTSKAISLNNSNLQQPLPLVFVVCWIRLSVSVSVR